MRTLLSLLLSALVGSAFAATPVTIESLLDEQTDRDAATRLPSETFRMRLWSSHDRASVRPDAPGWFANGDSSRFVRHETNVEGRVERVLLDAKGPGAIVRFWVTVKDIPQGGLLRFYVDGERVIEGAVFDVLSGMVLCGAPLADSVSKATRLDRRGHNLYLPIPYAQSCKVTVEYPGNAGANFYYNVEVREYAEDVRVESLTSAVLARAKRRIAEANRILAADCDDPLPERCETTFASGFKLAPHAERTFPFVDGGAVREVTMRYEDHLWRDRVPPVEALSLRLEFDGEATADLPAAFFFGGGRAPQPYQTRFCEDAITNDMEHAFRSRWVMPFRKTARVTLRNDSDLPCTIGAFSVTKGAYRWQEGRSMRFHVHYGKHRQIRTRRFGNHWDINYLTVEGRSGVLVGCGVSVLNSVRSWWGEGDEKIYVDGEAIPSYIGTGTEDFYGYAWCSPSRFSHPFVAQPDGSGNLTPGTSVCLRHRALDAIPFRSSLRFDMEIWHWKDCLVDYDTVCWYYLK